MLVNVVARSFLSLNLMDWILAWSQCHSVTFHWSGDSGLVVILVKAFVDREVTQGCLVLWHCDCRVSVVHQHLVATSPPSCHQQDSCQGDCNSEGYSETRGPEYAWGLAHSWNRMKPINIFLSFYTFSLLFYLNFFLSSSCFSILPCFFSVPLTFRFNFFLLFFIFHGLLLLL